jgi:hypothetical protein
LAGYPLLKACLWGNAIGESFFAILRTELIPLRIYATRDIEKRLLANRLKFSIIDNDYIPLSTISSLISLSLLNSTVHFLGKANK